MGTAGNILPILAMVALTTACKKEELVTPASVTTPSAIQASRPDVIGDQVIDQDPTTALQTNGYAFQAQPSALETAQQASGTLNTNVLDTRSAPIIARPIDSQLTAGTLRPDCSFPLAPGLENENTGTTKRSRRTPPIIPHLDD